jgi:aspartate/methionine/tyrosine aminotransferase
MPFEMSSLQKAVLQSEIRSMTIACNRIRGINLAQGICDCPLPAPVGAGAKEAIDNGINTYTRFDGLPELRAAIADKYRRFYSMTVDPEGEIVVSCGATGAFYCTCLALGDAGLTPVVPQGAYYVLADLTKVPGTGSREKAMNLLDKTRIACVPGCAFYHDTAGENLGRFCFAKKETVIDEVCSRLKNAYG